MITAALLFLVAAGNAHGGSLARQQSASGQRIALLSRMIWISLLLATHPSWMKAHKKFLCSTAWVQHCRDMAWFWSQLVTVPHHEVCATTAKVDCFRTQLLPLFVCCWLHDNRKALIGSRNTIIELTYVPHHIQCLSTSKDCKKVSSTAVASVRFI
jgi:hypothetical protein